MRRVSRHRTAAIERSLEGAPRATMVPTRWGGRRRMHPQDLMNADMLSEILLLVSASVLLVALSVILAAALTQTAALT